MSEKDYDISIYLYRNSFIPLVTFSVFTFGNIIPFTTIINYNILTSPIFALQVTEYSRLNVYYLLYTHHNDSFRNVCAESNQRIRKFFANESDFYPRLPP